MKKLKFILFGIIICLCGCKEKKLVEINIVPKPTSIVQGSDWIEWPTEIKIVANTDDERNVASFLQQFLLTKGIKGTLVTASTSTEAQIIFSGLHGDSIINEGYQLVINKLGVHIKANSGAGLFYGVQSLFQLVSSTSKGIELPFVEISDQPRFAWRGLHLDVGRHFFSVEFIKKYIDLMSHFKLNTFHWHLTEDQGWRIEIKKYPKLQEIAAHRKETVIGHASTRTRSEPHDFDGTPHGGYYTQEEIKEVVAYAAQRYVTIVPEIELPGHALAALAAYPELGCTGGTYEVATTWGIFNEVFCAGKETTFEFLQNVLDEVIPLFPGKYVHIGGDECFKDSWKKCPHCQKRIVTEKLKDEHELQSYFIQRIEEYVNAKGKTIIGWDEILEGGLAPNAAVMSWRGEEGGIAAAKQNHDVVMTPSKWLYLDYMQDSSASEPLAVKVLVDVQTVYLYDPVPTQFTPAQARHVLGVQANVWSEYMKSGKHVEYMVYPRAIALAEVGWTVKEDKNYDDFIKRLRANQQLLEEWNVNYAKHVFEKSKP
ncbi:MAG TPA: beta-N-acetylhexosaminidase [Chryseolinea sp.]|nr:beta-N-acetylhexosaminidase [Chryseolinea sp.]HPH46430.1 beta-N-acetylhexosaminidase [Chryseolinea sp.]HPM32793.1 beta-N-acetylhexosaminidase [Chryseolinea sp.]